MCIIDTYCNKSHLKAYLDVTNQLNYPCMKSEEALSLVNYGYVDKRVHSVLFFVKEYILLLRGNSEILPIIGHLGSAKQVVRPTIKCRSQGC